MYDDHSFKIGQQVIVRACPKCGWWESEKHAHIEIDKDQHSYNSYSLFRRACLREFEIFDDAAPLDALRNHLKRNSSDLNRISPKKLELLVGSILSDFLTCEVKHVGGPNDGGYDLLLLLGDQPALVQVKQRQSRKKAESVRGIRELVGAMVIEGNRTGFFVTTAPRFSKPAQRAAASVRPTLERIELVDASQLLDMLAIVSKDKEPWRHYSHVVTEGIEDFSRYREPKLITYNELIEFYKSIKPDKF